MIRDRIGDANLKRFIIIRHDAWVTPNDNIHTKYPGRLTGPKWCYRDNPVNGLGEKEYREHFSDWENPTPWYITDEYGSDKVLV